MDDHRNREETEVIVQKQETVLEVKADPSDSVDHLYVNEGSSMSKVSGKKRPYSKSTVMATGEKEHESEQKRRV